MNLFDLIAPCYDRLMGAPDEQRLRELLQLPSAGLLLDAGGGTGRVSSHLASSKLRCVVADLSAGMLKAARAKEAICPVRADVHCLPFAQESFDRILIVDAFHHFSEASTVLKELLRVLKPGGRLLIEEFNMERYLVKLAALTERLFGTASRFYSAEGIMQLLALNGSVGRIHRASGYKVWITADK
ncbi:MAG: methyltransferase domain-containing protein [Smithellaceae bacterium]|nr:methyltransferase domain-containing protein [Smithellaceae bacterium]